VPVSLSAVETPSEVAVASVPVSESARAEPGESAVASELDWLSARPSPCSSESASVPVSLSERAWAFPTVGVATSVAVSLSVTVWNLPTPGVAESEPVSESASPIPGPVSTASVAVSESATAEPGPVEVASVAVSESATLRPGPGETASEPVSESATAEPGPVANVSVAVSESETVAVSAEPETRAGPGLPVELSWTSSMLYVVPAANNCADWPKRTVSGARAPNAADPVLAIESSAVVLSPAKTSTLHAPVEVPRPVKSNSMRYHVAVASATVPAGVKPAFALFVTAMNWLGAMIRMPASAVVPLRNRTIWPETVNALDQRM
jgi:hypothetical protein